MLKRLGVDLQPHVDTIHHAAVESLRNSPDPQTLATGRKALEAIIEHSEYARNPEPLVRAAHLTEESLKLVLGQSAAHKVRSGHYVAAIVADLSRIIDAIDSGDDPESFLRHAESLFGSMHTPDQENLVEIDLNDRDQLLRLVQETAAEPDPAESAVSATADLSSMHQTLEMLARHAETLLESGETEETLAGLVQALESLQLQAADLEIDHVSRVVACALRVVESHRSAREPLPLDAIEFIIACRRIIPMILESRDSPGRVSHAVDALVDQSAFVLIELRRGTSPLGNLWPEPDAEAYEAIANGAHPREPDEPLVDVPGEHFDDPTPGKGTQPEWRVEEYRPPSGALTGTSPTTENLTEDRETVRVPVQQVDALMEIAGELAIRSGGYNQRARQVLSATQDINSIADRLRYLVRAWQEGRYQNEHIQQHLTEISADLALASTDLDHARGDHIAASERQAEARSRLEQTVSGLRCMPLKVLTDQLEDEFPELAKAYGRKATLRVEGAANVFDAVHAERLLQAFRNMIVNALEHGIEPPDVRQERGKSPTGLIRFRARRDGSQSVIQIIDDGAGMDESTILDRAEASGYPVPRRDMTRERVLQYVFLPGFTTRITGTDEEAGKGLDFVSSAISSASGALTVQSEPGQGTAFTVRIPVTRMAIPSMVVSISSECYALPAADIRPVPAERIDGIDERQTGYLANVDDTTVPAVDLGAMLGLRSHHHVQSEHGAFLEVSDDEGRWIIRVDRIVDHEQIMLEPLGRQHYHLTGVVGTATLNSGEHALVLDVIQILDAGNRRSRRLSRQTASLTRVPFALVSDDSISVRRNLARFLEDEGWRVVEARDAFEARELLETIAPDLLIVDLDLPAHGGFQIAQAARNLGDIPIVGLTARDNPDLRDRIASFRIDQCLIKPVDTNELAETIRRINRAQEADG